MSERKPAVISCKKKEHKMLIQQQTVDNFSPSLRQSTFSCRLSKEKFIPSDKKKKNFCTTTLLKHTFFSHKIQLLFYTLGIKIAWTSQNFIGNIFTNP